MLYVFRFGSGDGRERRTHREGSPTIHTHPLPGDEPTCLCGALLDDDNPTLCRKCSARSRWQRRRRNARRHTTAGAATPPSDPPQS